MTQTVSGHQQGAFTTPADGAAIVASVLRGNYTSLRTSHNAHDSDSGIHLQSSVVGSRPSAGTAGRKWLTSDTLKVYFDNGSTWDEIAYAPTAAPTFTGGLTVADSGITVTGNSTITGTLGGLTGLTMASGTLAAVDLTVSGAFTPSTIQMGATGKIVSGATSIKIMDELDTTALFQYAVSSKDITLTTPSTGDIILSATGSGGIQLSAGATGMVQLGATNFLTSDTKGFCRFGDMAGIPSGAADNNSFVIDSTNSRIYVRVAGTWKYAALT